MNNTFCINWIGPFHNVEDMKIWEKNNQEIIFNFYVITGKLKGKKSITGYCGITEQDYIHKRFNKFHKVHDFSRDTNIWIGYLTDEKLAEKRENIELCEAMIISFWQPEGNTLKKAYYPSYPVFLINRWYKTDCEPRKKAIYTAQRKIPDVIIYQPQHKEIYGAERLKKLASIE